MDTLFEQLDRLSKPFGPLLDVVLGRLAPHTTASACGGTFCHAACTRITCGTAHAYIKYYAASKAACAAGHYNCQTAQCIC